jgi:hypothetical protein
MKILYSKKLQDYIVIVANTAEANIARKNYKYQIYTEREVELLKGKDTELIQFCHAAKKILSGEIVGISKSKAKTIP